MTRGGGKLIEPGRRHIDAMVALRVESLRRHAARQPHVFAEPADPAALRRDLARYVPGWNPLAGRWRRALGWEAEGRLGAYLLYAHGATQSYLFRPKNVLFVDDIAVDVSLQGRGIARRLLAELATRAARDGVDEIAATVWDGNDASARLFEAAGFAVEHRRYTRRIGADGGAAGGA